MKRFVPDVPIILVGNKADARADQSFIDAVSNVLYHVYNRQHASSNKISDGHFLRKSGTYNSTLLGVTPLYPECSSKPTEKSQLQPRRGKQ